MGFLDYSNQTHSNIIPKEEFESLTQEVFNVIAENISKSLGPLGSIVKIRLSGGTEVVKCFRKKVEWLKDGIREKRILKRSGLQRIMFEKP